MLDLSREAKTQAVVLFPFVALIGDGCFSVTVLSIYKECAYSFFSPTTRRIKQLQTELQLLPVTVDYSLSFQVRA